jgi:hypothetical protein
MDMLRVSQRGARKGGEMNFEKHFFQILKFITTSQYQKNTDRCPRQGLRPVVYVTNGYLPNVHGNGMAVILLND